MISLGIDPAGEFLNRLGLIFHLTELIENTFGTDTSSSARPY